MLNYLLVIAVGGGGIITLNNFLIPTDNFLEPNVFLIKTLKIGRIRTADKEE